MGDCYGPHLVGTGAAVIAYPGTAATRRTARIALRAACTWAAFAAVHCFTRHIAAYVQAVAEIEVQGAGVYADVFSSVVAIAPSQTFPLVAVSQLSMMTQRDARELAYPNLLRVH